MARKRNKGSNFTLKQPVREIKMVRFLGYDWVVTNSYMRGVARHYDLVGASHEELGIAGQVLKRVPRASIIKYPDAHPDKSITSYKVS